MPTDEDYYKPITTKGVFNNNYIQYESMGGGRGRGKNLSVEEYLDRIKPYSGNKTIEHKTQSEWKIQ